jgi:LmbE family N-acetylglucosaminyl deacetylase
MRALELVKPRTHRRPLQILALGAHCDDIDIGCGGTMLSLLERHREAEVTWVVMGSNPVR